MKSKFADKNKKIIMMIPRIIILMLLTAYMSGFVKTGYDYVFVSVVIIVLGIFLFFTDIQKYLRHI